MTSIDGVPNDVDSYIAAYPPETRQLLQDLRTLIRDSAPDATERISYGIPTFDLNGRYLVYFGAWKKHIALYPVTPGLERALGAEISPYRSGKGTLKFLLNRPIPLDVIERIVRFRITEIQSESSAENRRS